MPTTRRALWFSLLWSIAACSDGDTPSPSPAPDPGRQSPENRALREPAVSTPAPDVFKVRFETTVGPIVIECQRVWAPHGVDRFHQLVEVGYFEDIAIFRVLPGAVMQFGIHGDPEISSAWARVPITDDAVVQPNRRGAVSFAMAGPNTRTTQLFVNLKDNGIYNRMGFAPIGFVVEGMDAVDRAHSGYGERPQQPRIESEGNAYLRAEFPELDYIRSARIVR